MDHKQQHIRSLKRGDVRLDPIRVIITRGWSLIEQIDRLKKTLGSRYTSGNFPRKQELDKAYTDLGTMVKTMRGELIRLSATSYVLVNKLNKASMRQRAWLIPVSPEAEQIADASGGLSYSFGVHEDKPDWVMLVNPHTRWIVWLKPGRRVTMDPEHPFSFIRLSQAEAQRSEPDLYAQACRPQDYPIQLTRRRTRP